MAISQRAVSQKALSNQRRVAAASSVLVGDIGGTNARLGIWDVDGTAAIFSKTYATEQYKSFEDVMEVFMGCQEVRSRYPSVGTLAIAQNICQDDCCQMTNLSWLVNGPALSDAYGFQVYVLNDFEAVGHGISALSEDDLVPLNHALIKAKAPKVVIGPGTGLGAAQLMWDSGHDQYVVMPGEAGHATFTPRGWKQQALAQYVVSKYGHCETEQVACGDGLRVIYEFLLTDERANRPHLLSAAQKRFNSIAAVSEIPKLISAAALDGSDPIAVEAVDMLLAIVGQQAGAMALTCLAKGGVYIGGGVANRVIRQVMVGALLEGFLMRHGRPEFHKLLADTPLFLIKNEEVGQLGAHAHAKRMLGQAGRN
ncbi:MAG: hypothetical protein WDW38_011008 [Sanguina aurantia]